MPSFSAKSKAKLDTCNSLICHVMEAAIKEFDFTVIHGYRDKETQNALFESGASKLMFPHSKHNRYLSAGIDIAPWPIDWQDAERFTYLAGLVMGIASQLGVNLTWGGDWDGDTELSDNRFNDLGHFHLRDSNET